MFFLYKCGHSVLNYITRQRSLTVRLNLHKKLKSNEDEQLHYSESEKRDETRTIVELGSNTLDHRKP